MLLKLLNFAFTISLVICGPHSHKTKESLKENVENVIYTSRDNQHYKDGKHNHEFDHEAVLGSHDAAEEFDHLSPEESKRRLALIAKKMDVDQDNFVSKEELTNWVLHSFKMLTEEEALEEFEDEDINQNGKVEWEEHASETYGIFDDDNKAFKGLPEESQMYENDLELFNAADLNNDGALDKSEFPYFSHPEEFENMHEIVYKQAMRKRDRNSDGFLDFGEFMADSHGLSPDPNTEHYLTEKDRFQNDYDKDGDGKLNKEEVISWVIPDNRETAETEADHLIESSDDNFDKKLSLEEIIQHYDIFVGSEVTDFGGHINNVHKFSDEL